LTLLSGGIGGYYLSASRRERRELDKRLLELGGNPWVVAELRKSFLLRWGDRFDKTERAKELQKQLVRAALNLKPSEFVAASVFLGVVVFFFTTMFLRTHPFLNIALAIASARHIPKLFLRARRNRYIEIFNAQLVEVAMTMSNALRAGLSIHQAIGIVARELPPPAGYEFGLLARKLGLGAEIDEAAQEMLERLPSEELRVLMTAILVQRKVGGNLAKALAEMSRTMDERKRLNEEIKTMTAQARYSSLIIPLLPIGMLILLRNAMPEFVEPLFNNPIGWVILAIFGSTQVLAYIMIRKIANIKV
jgi:tight adherence protein B